MADCKIFLSHKDFRLVWANMFPRDREPPPPPASGSFDLGTAHGVYTYVDTDTHHDHGDAVIAQRCPDCGSLETDNFTLDGSELICRRCGNIWRPACGSQT